MNLYFANPNFQNLYSALIYAWKSGLKTGCYYLRSKPATEAIKISMQPANDKNKQFILDVLKTIATSETNRGKSNKDENIKNKSNKLT